LVIRVPRDMMAVSRGALRYLLVTLWGCKVYKGGLLVTTKGNPSHFDY